MSGRRWLNRGSQLDAQLRSSRPQARDEFVKSLAQHVGGPARTATRARSRLAFAGADKDHFTILPGPAPTWRVRRDVAYPSHIDLPVIPQ